MATNLKIPFAGLSLLLDTLRLFLTSNLTANIALYQNNKTPAADDELSDYDLADYSGHAPQGLASGGAGVIDPTPDAGGRAVCNWGSLVFAHNGGGVGNTIYGYVVYDDSDPDRLLWAQRVPDDPVSMSVSGDTITIVPQLTLKSEF